MSDQITVEFEGVIYKPFEVDGEWSDLFESDDLDDDMKDLLRRVVTLGRIIMPGGAEATPAQDVMTRRYFLGARFGLPATATSAEVTWLLPGLMSVGTHHAMGGNAKSGKSTGVGDLTGTLTTRGRRFLGQIEANLDTDPRHHDHDGIGRLFVVVFNAEIEPNAFEDGLAQMGVDLDSPWLQIVHLEQLWGGPGALDVTDPAKYEEVMTWLLECEDGCEKGEYWSPSMVIVDGVSSILEDAGKSIEDFGIWFARWKRLMRETDVPNSLAVGHNTLAGGHLMGGASAQAHPDGLWSYDCSYPDDPNSPRYFSVRARFGGVSIPRTRVLLDNGLPVLDTKAASRRELEREPSTDRTDSDARADAMRATLREAGVAGTLKTKVTGDGDEGRANREVFSRMEEAGEITTKLERNGRTRSIRCWLTEFAPAD